MAQPTQLTPTEQDALVKQIGLAMLRVAPDDWEQLTVDYRAVGRYSESTGRVVFSDGTSEPWTMPPDLQGLFARLRGGMYREGRGTWFNARYRLDHPSSYNLEYDREEPEWEAPPPPQAYPDDMRLFPRTEDNVPGWLRRRLAAAPPPRFRVARIFDGPPGEDGRPAVNRPPVDHDDVAVLLKYLDNAPVVGPARGFDIDRFDPEGRPAVPVAFHTDGAWIWPAAVNYYLREHEVPPEPELVEHIMRSHFQQPMVDDATRAAAAAFLGPGVGPVPGGPGGPGPGGPGPGPGGPGPGPGGPGGPPRVPPPGAGPAPTRAMPVPPPAGGPGAPPPAALPSHGPPGRTVEALRTRLDELGIPPTAYRIGPPAGRAWTMDQTEEGWRVGWFDREFVSPAMFEDVADASAFMLGKLLLDADRWQAGPAGPQPPGMPVPPAPVPPPPENPADFALASDPAEVFTPPAAAPPTVVAPPVGRPDSPRAAFDFDGGSAMAETRFSPPADSPRPEATYTPPGSDRVEPVPTFDLSGPGGSRSKGEHELPDSPFTSRSGRDSAFQPQRSESRFEPSRPESRFEPQSPASGFEQPRPDSTFEPSRSERGLEQRSPGSGFDQPRPETDFEPRRPGSAFESQRPEPSFEPQSPASGFEQPRSEHFEPRSPAPGFEQPRPGSAFESPRPETDFEPSRSEQRFEPRSPGSGFDQPRPETDFEPRRPGSAFESQRPEPNLEPARSGSAFETSRSESRFEQERPETDFEPARSRSAFEPQRPEPSRSESEFDAPRRASRPDTSFDATRVDTPFAGTREPVRPDSGFESQRPEPRGERAPAKHEAATTVAAPPSRPAATGGAAANQEWPISPLPGEPPLTLFRGKQLTELEPGTEFDRFGEDDGNLVYAFGTPFHQRSLVPEWVERPYHAYRVIEPMQALTGAAIPWFDQPGGGTAYLLPESIGDLVAAGRVVELNGRERPPA